jgi:DNA-3-methyladenine glycosylase
MLNVVTSVKNSPHAVLIRAIEPLSNLSTIKERRVCQSENYLLTGGPGKICQALNINKSHNNLKLYNEKSAISIYEDDYEVNNITATPRVGMSIYVGAASHWPWRFYISNNKYVSRPLQLKYNW